MYSKSMVIPSATLLEPGIGVWPPDRTANWHNPNKSSAVRTFMIVDTSSAVFGCTIQLGVSLLFPSKYEAMLALYAT